MRTIFFALLGIGAAACAGDDAPVFMEGFEPPPPGEGEIQFVSPILEDMAPGADITLCTYLDPDLSFEDTVDVVAGRGYQSMLGGHHAILYTAERNRPIGTHECTDDDMVNARFLVGAGGGDAGGAYADIPEGLAYQIDAGRQLMVQTHWINTTTQPIDGQAAFNIRVQPPSDEVQHAQLMNWLTTDISIPAGGTAAVRGDCVVQQDLNFYLMGGHAHEHGTRVTLTHTPAGGEPTVFYDEEWVEYYTFDPPRISMDVAAPMVVRAGDTLSVDCTYDNPGSEALGFPTEMCVGFGFYFPATRQIDCVDGSWPE